MANHKMTYKTKQNNKNQLKLIIYITIQLTTKYYNNIMLKYTKE